VTSNPKSATRRTHAPLARVLAFVLLALVTYAATAEAVHRHGGLALARSGNSVTSYASSGDDNSSANDSRSTGECLICQLRQHLSTSLFSALPQVVAPQEQMARTVTVALPSRSRPDTPERGRAPPLASLF
jgi:hypothetical protein